MNKSVYIIAEAGVNHNGSLKTALELAEVAAEAGADAVKFQTFKADNLVSRFAPKAEYQKKTTSSTEPQYNMIKKLELNEESHIALLMHCKGLGIEFLSTPFDIKSLDFLVNILDLHKIKLPSGEITNGPLLLKAARSGKPIILSTGMSTLGDIETALGILAFGYIRSDIPPCLNSFLEAYGSEKGQNFLKEKLTLLHCTTEYPAPFSEVNLRAIEILNQTFRIPVGYSDHTEGISVPVAAVALGATIIEKHFTLDRDLPGPDHKASIEPDDLKRMVKSIREVELSMGASLKHPSPSEMKNRLVARKSLVASQPIHKGEPFTPNNLTVKRPGDGISPIHYWDWLDKVSDRDYLPDERIKF